MASVQLYSALSLEECARRLGLAVDSFEFKSWKAQVWNRKGMLGAVDERRFVLREPYSIWPSIFSPVGLGRWSVQTPGTGIEIRFRISLIAWTVLSLSVIAVMGMIAHQPSDGPSLWPVGLWLVCVGATARWQWKARRYMIRFLQGVLDAEVKPS